MKSRLKGRGLVVAVVAGLVTLVGSGVALSDTTFTDPPGDSGAAPDITQLVVLNDLAGTITLRVTTALPIGDASLIFIGLDADSNPSTGDFGDEYLLAAGLGGFTRIEKWDGTNWVKTTVPSLVSVISGNVVELRIARQDVGIVTSFGVSAAAALFDANDKFVTEDDAPDSGQWIYVLAFPQCSNGKDDDRDGKVDSQDLGCSSPSDILESDDPVTLRSSKVIVSPTQPRAGKKVLVSAPITRVETGLGISSGTARCVARVGATTLKGVGNVGSGRASCRFTMPAAAKGKTARGTMTVTHLARTAVIPFTFRVK